MSELGPLHICVAEWLGVLVGFLAVGAGGGGDLTLESFACLWDSFPLPGLSCPALMGWYVVYGSTFG